MCIAQACCKKYTYDIRLHLHAFVQHCLRSTPVVYQKLSIKNYQNSEEYGELIID